jgi:hypothetical protein
MAGVQKTQEQFSACPSLDTAAPAHPCARGMLSIPGHQKKGVTTVTPWFFKI